MKHSIKIILVLISLSLFFSCKTVEKPETRTPGEVFKSALEAYKEEDYEESQKLFDLIKLQYPASQFADDAQFYIAEINFARKEYIMASYNYNRLRSTYPGSEYSKQSLYNAAMCYFELSPTYDRDQDYTKKAIQAFQDFQYLYPDDELYEKANERIADLRNKLAHKDFFTAGLYRKLDSPKSALIYYDLVIKNFDDTKYYEPAYYGKIETLILMKRYDQALGLIQLYKQSFAKGGEHINDVIQLENQIRSEQ